MHLFAPRGRRKGMAIFKKLLWRRGCKRSVSELPEVPLIYPCHKFWVNGCNIGPEGSLKMVLSIED